MTNPSGVGGMLDALADIDRRNVEVDELRQRHQADLCRINELEAEVRELREVVAALMGTR